MKKLSLLTLLLALCFGFMQAQTYNVTVSGQVINVNGGAPIPNFPVDIRVDSNFFGFVYANTVTTDGSGNYSDVIVVPGGVTVANGMTGVNDCNPGGYLTNWFSFTGPATIPNLDFAICPSTGGCQAAYSAVHVPGTTTFNFTDMSSTTAGGINSWMWSFGDGNTSSLQNPSHSYNVQGSYTVCLTIGTSGGCSSTYCDSIYIGGGGGINCQATLNASVTPGGAVAFTTTASGTGNIVLYTYDFGDGNVLSSNNSNETHTYVVNGTYTACVYVDFSDSCRATACTTVTVGGALNCQAGFFWYPDSSGQYSILVVNTSTGTNPTYLWDFGDNTTSTQAYPSHTYNGPGTYVVCVTISTQNPNCTDTYCDSLVVVNKVAAPFSINVIANGATAVSPEAASAATVNLYPNPAHDFFQVQLGLVEGMNVNVSLMDLSGRVVATENAGLLNAGTHNLRVATQDLPAGMYLARVQTGGSYSTHKVMIAR